MTVRRILLEPFAPRTWARTAYALAALPLGVAWFTLVVTGLSVGGSLLITLVGVPLIWLTLIACGFAADLERGWARIVLGVTIPAPARKQLAGDRWYGPMLARLADPQAWRDVVALALSFVTGLAAFVVAVCAWSVAGFLLASPLYVPFLEDTDFLWDGNRLDTVWEWAGTPLAGVAALLLAPWLVRAVTAIHVGVFRALLGPTRGALAREADRLSETRAQSVDAAAQERRRIERDLHDGAQARLVSLAMDLGRARERLERGVAPAEVAGLIEGAHEEAKRALAELRDLARGIHPAVLTDRGLDAALSALAARSAVPTSIRVSLTRRPPASIEAIAYFVAAEALANVAKHAGATAAEIRVGDSGNVVTVTVSDNGRGGAGPRPGSGLAGLEDRVAGVDGTLTVSSPPGAGTTVTAVLPCG